MSKWKKSSPEVVARFEELLPEDPRVEQRQMFGYPCAFALGNMFMGLFQDDMILRLPEGDRVTLLEADEASEFTPMPGRSMREYVVLTEQVMTDEARIHGLVEKSLEFACSKGPKIKAVPKKKRS